VKEKKIKPGAVSNGAQAPKTSKTKPAAAKKTRPKKSPSDLIIRVCMGLGGISAGGEEVLRSFAEKLAEKGLEAQTGSRCRTQKVGCMGFCAKDVLVDVILNGQTSTYQFVKPDMVERIINEHILAGRPVLEWLAGPEYEAFHQQQKKIVLTHCGLIDPEDIQAYLAVGGYEAARKALSSQNPDQIIQEIKASGLRGRGGAGFPTGIKWEACRRSPGDQKYIICNADEGDPGAFMDRAVIEGDPHAVIEGMIIGAYAMGASEGIVYIRAEYPLAIERLKLALLQAREQGFLGKGLFGSPFDFDIRVKLGAGAFVCGEETALIASLEDQIGEPRPRPPFPAQSGLWGRPTNINNVETWATVPKIIQNGAAWFAAIGTEKSKGTKIFSLVGKIRNTGLVEVPLGIPLRKIIYGIGGGIPNEKQFKAVQTGGPSGGCIPWEHIDVPVDYENLTALGSIVGSGGMVVLDEDNCMVDVAKFFVSFCMDESCGKCSPCREGTREMVKLLEEISQGKGTATHLNLLEELCLVVKETSLCGLGKTAPNPVLTTIRYFKDEYLAHIVEKRCPAGVCKPLITYEINPEQCTGCMACARNCPQACISGEKKKPHVIDKKKCIRCGICMESCKFDAVIVY
jgi:NADH:ubiquinone oxidoreductase subunit F (NADH-binding)